MRRTPLALCLLALVLIQFSSAAGVKPVHSCFNTVSSSLGNAANYSSRSSMDGSLNSKENFNSNADGDGDAVVVDLNASYPITSYSFWVSSNNCNSAYNFQLSASNSQGGPFTAITTTNAVCDSGPFQFSAEIAPSKYRYWKVSTQQAQSGGNNRFVNELQLNATAQSCVARFFKLLSYENASNWTAAYAESSLNSTLNSNNLVYDNSTNASSFESEFNDYGASNPFNAFLNSTNGLLYSAHKTSKTNGNCRYTRVRSYSTLLRSASTITEIDSGWHGGGSPAFHPLAAGVFENFLFLSLRSVDNCVTGGNSFWKNYRINLLNAASEQWVNDSQTEFGSASIFASGSQRYSMLYQGSIANRTYFFNSNASDGTVLTQSGSFVNASYYSNTTRIVFSSSLQGNFNLFTVPATCGGSCAPYALTNTSWDESLQSIYENANSTVFVAYTNSSNDVFVEGFCASDSFPALGRSCEQNTAPSINISSQASTQTLRGNITVSWNSSDAENDSLSFNATLNGTQQICATTANNCSFNTSSVSDGAYRIVVFASDARNTANASSAAFAIDNTLPAISLSTPANSSNVSAQPVVFTVVATDNLGLANTSLLHNSTGWHVNQTNSSPANATQTLLPSNLPEGAFIWSARACDNAGNCALATENRTVVVDRTAPTIALPLYANASLRTNAQGLTLNISSSDVFVGVEGVCFVSVGQGANQTIAFAGGWCNSSAINLSGLSDGNKSVFVYANDSAGNLGVNDSFVVQIDSTPPTISNLSASQVTQTSATITWSTSEPANSTLEHGTTSALATNLTNASFATNPSHGLSGLSPSTTYFYRAHSCDALGNCNASAIQSFTTQAQQQGGGQSPGGGGGFAPGSLSPPQQPTPTPSVARASPPASPSPAAAENQQATQKTTEGASSGTKAASSPTPAATASPTPAPALGPLTGGVVAGQLPFTGLVTENKTSISLLALLLAVALLLYAWRKARRKKES